MNLPQIRERIYAAAHSYRERSPKLPTLIAYLKATFGESIIIEYTPTSRNTGRQLPSGVYYTQSWAEGYRLRLAMATEENRVQGNWSRHSMPQKGIWYYLNFEHDTTYAYVRNNDVCKFIVKLHEEYKLEPVTL
jgi:hypothetical protein